MPRLTAWKVFSRYWAPSEKPRRRTKGKRLIDVVFYDPDCDEEYVRRGLVEHDGYPSDIEIERAEF